jgi:tetratricopeptide (TPR) repeat protein
MSMSRHTTLALVLVAAVGGYQTITHANGSSMGGGSAAASTPTAERTPEELARDSYNSGISHKDKGDKLEAQAEKEAKDREKNLDKAKDEYTKGMKDFQKALDLMPTMYQAYNGMGYTSRKTGDYAKALQMYDKALSLAPGFPDAIEYRGVAYLKLNRIEDAKKAYLDLFARDRKQADELMKAMNQWVSDHTTDPAGVDASTVSGLSTWIQERAKIATSTSAMALTGHRSIWN